MVNDWPNKIQSLCYPGCCVLCGERGVGVRDLCNDCLAEFPKNDSACKRCALPLPQSAAGQLCGGCQKQPPVFDRCFAPLHYRHPVDHLLIRLKFHQKLANARLLGSLLAQWLRPDELPQWIIPVPLHSARLRERGYNQALELARPVARHWNIPIDIRSCRRDTPTAPQTGLNAKQRRANLRGAFSLNRRMDASHVAIVDDVITTGHTVNELARTLRKAGVERIDVWACARAPLLR